MWVNVKLDQKLWGTLPFKMHLNPIHSPDCYQVSGILLTCPKFESGCQWRIGYHKPVHPSRMSPKRYHHVKVSHKIHNYCAGMLGWLSSFSRYGCRITANIDLGSRQIPCERVNKLIHSNTIFPCINEKIVLEDSLLHQKKCRKRRSFVSIVVWFCLSWCPSKVIPQWFLHDQNRTHYSLPMQRFSAVGDQEASHIPQSRLFSRKTNLSSPCLLNNLSSLIRCTSVALPKCSGHLSRHEGRVRHSIH